MPEASKTVVIRRPPADVFAFLADVGNDPRWRSGVLEISKQSGEGKGAVWHQVVAGPGGRRINADIEITDYEPGSLLGFRTISGPVRPTGRFELAAAEGGTRVAFSLQAELGGVKKLLMGGMVQKTMNAEVEALETLKGVLEQPQAG